MATSDTEGSLVNMPEYMRTITAVGTLLTAILAADVAMTKAAFAHEEHGRFSAGEPGEATKPTRIIEVKMFEGGGKMGFQPARIKVRRGGASPLRSAQ
jgi:uncharacterized cupredoxin-like copper-binding protein